MFPKKERGDFIPQGVKKVVKATFFEFALCHCQGRKQP